VRENAVARGSAPIWQGTIRRKTPSCVRLRATKRMLRQWLVSYRMEILDECKNTAQSSSPPNGVHGVNGVNGGVGASSNGAASQEPSQAGDLCPQCGESLTLVVEGRDCTVATARCIQYRHDRAAACRALPRAVARGSERLSGNITFITEDLRSYAWQGRTDLLDKRPLAVLLETSKRLIYQTLVSGQPLSERWKERAAIME
jgi:hypothetical protein